MKKLFLLISIVVLTCIPEICKAQLSFNDIIKISGFFKTFYKTNPDLTTNSIYQVKLLGYDISHFEWTEDKNKPGFDYTEYYTFLDLINDSTKESLEIHMLPNMINYRYGVDASVTTDNFNQYKSWKADIISEPKYEKVRTTVNQEIWETKQNTSQTNFRITIDLPYKNAPLPSGTTGVSMDFLPSKYKITVTRLVPL